MDVLKMNELAKPLDEQAMQKAREHWNQVAKPIGSMGLMEDIVTRIAGMSGTAQVDVKKRAVLAMCADNGVVAEGVTQTGQEITTLVAGNMAKRISSVCQMAALANIDIVPVDIGIVTPSDVPGVVNRSIARGTANMVEGPAMTKEQALQALNVGIDMVGALKGEGYRLIVTGEMGIGNTTTSSAVAAVMLGLPVEEVTGRGAGLSSAGLDRKIAAIKKAIEVNEPNSQDALDVLSKVGGFDIAGMAGTFIGGAIHGVPVLIDGFISAISALVAASLCPQCKDYMIATHVSAEPAAKMVLERLGVVPVIYAGMRLGEGTGAVCLVPMLDMTMALYDGASFETIGMDAYEADLK